MAKSFHPPNPHPDLLCVLLTTHTWLIAMSREWWAQGVTKPAKLGAEPWSWASLLWLLLCPWNAWIRAGQQGKLAKAAWESAIPCLTVPGTGEWECSLAAQPFDLELRSHWLLVSWGKRWSPTQGSSRPRSVVSAFQTTAGLGSPIELWLFSMSHYILVDKQAMDLVFPSLFSFLSGKGLDGWGKDIWSILIQCKWIL